MKQRRQHRVVGQEDGRCHMHRLLGCTTPHHTIVSVSVEKSWRSFRLGSVAVLRTEPGPDNLAVGRYLDNQVAPGARQEIGVGRCEVNTMKVIEPRMGNYRNLLTSAQHVDTLVN